MSELIAYSAILSSDVLAKDGCKYFILQILDVSAVDIIREKVKNCQVEILSSCGHAITLERPWKSAKLILKFINSLPKFER